MRKRNPHGIKKEIKNVKILKGKQKQSYYTIFPGGKHHAEKYNENFIHKWLIHGFMDSLVRFVERTGKTKIFEVGCGEGQLLGVLYGNGYDIAGMDLDEEAVKMSNDNFASWGVRGGISITQGNIYDLRRNDERIKNRMLICCEVLEHIPDSENGMKILSECTDEYFIVSVPHEPIWRILNMLRGKYLKDFGNTTGHIHHWSKKDFIKLVAKYGEVVEISTPLPWIMVLAKAKRRES